MKITPTNTIPESLGPAWGRSEGNPWNLCFSMRALHCCHCRQMVTLLWVRVYMGLRVWRGLREFSNSFPCSLFGPCNVYWGRQSETKHCPVTLENVEPWKHQSQKAILGRSPPTLAHVQPSSCLGWQQDLAINGRFCAYSPNPSLTPAQQFSCSSECGDQNPSVTGGTWEPGKGICHWGAAKPLRCFSCVKRGDQRFSSRASSPGSTNGPGVEIDGGAKAQKINPNSCLMDKNFPAYRLVYLALNSQLNFEGVFCLNSPHWPFSNLSDHFSILFFLPKENPLGFFGCQKARLWIFGFDPETLHPLKAKGKAFAIFFCTAQCRKVFRESRGEGWPRVCHIPGTLSSWSHH